MLALNMGQAHRLELIRVVYAEGRAVEWTPFLQPGWDFPVEAGGPEFVGPVVGASYSLSEVSEEPRVVFFVGMPGIRPATTHDFLVEAGFPMRRLEEVPNLSIFMGQSISWDTRKKDLVIGHPVVRRHTVKVTRLEWQSRQDYQLIPRIHFRPLVISGVKSHSLQLSFQQVYDHKIRVGSQVTILGQTPRLQLESASGPEPRRRTPPKCPKCGFQTIKVTEDQRLFCVNLRCVGQREAQFHYLISTHLAIPGVSKELSACLARDYDSVLDMMKGLNQDNKPTLMPHKALRTLRAKLRSLDMEGQWIASNALNYPGHTTRLSGQDLLLLESVYGHPLDTWGTTNRAQLYKPDWSFEKAEANALAHALPKFRVWQQQYHDLVNSMTQEESL